jgi:hypothetical protein
MTTLDPRRYDVELWLNEGPSYIIRDTKRNQPVANASAYAYSFYSAELAQQFLDVFVQAPGQFGYDTAGTLVSFLAGELDIEDSQAKDLILRVAADRGDTHDEVGRPLDVADPADYEQHGAFLDVTYWLGDAWDDYAEAAQRLHYSEHQK